MEKEDKLTITIETMKQILRLSIDSNKELLEGKKRNRLFWEGMIYAQEQDLKTLDALFPEAQ